MSKHYRSTHDLLSSLKELLAPNPRRKPEEVMDEVVEQLQQGRGYSWIGIYLAASGEGPDTTHGTPHPQSKSRLVQSIRIGTRTLGIIEVESDRFDTFSSQECALLEQLAELLARYLTTSPGKLLSRKAREKSHLPQSAAELHKSPQSARPEIGRAAVGKHSAR